MSPQIADNTAVTRDELLDFIRPRHHAIVITARADGRPQASPVTCGVDAEGRIVVATFPERAKTRKARRNEQVSVLVLSDHFGGPWVQVDGTAACKQALLGHGWSPSGLGNCKGVEPTCATSLLDHGWSFWPAFVATLILSFGAGIALQQVLIRPLQGSPLLAVVLLTVGLLIAINGLTTWIWGGRTACN